ncbi:hypothetical protein [Denitrobaculum tricleocarpae]|uniref:Uncharacterized protein n=1 Tax=Denitrobaculum tricleocarpae TaxID=2591009 RepID=A0A545TN20_9PROT|nr:hypothetical protein [Denitrobaculum tricleocarpae]TQV78622.1 hypothetical protein FKG95_18920 [Denitrobaculum tricleocarpae]
MTRPRYQKNLPQLGSTQLLTDGGIETTLMFHDGHDLPLLPNLRVLGAAAAPTIATSTRSARPAFRHR